MCDVFDVPKVRRFVQLMKDFDLRELELRQGDACISLKRGADADSGVAVPAMTPMQIPAQIPPQSSAQSAGDSSASTTTNAAPNAEAPYIETVNSPIVGTFYSRPNPNAAAFASVGDTMDAEKTICIIEAMKVMNQIPAGVSGKVTAVLAHDGDTVEYGQPLFKIYTRG